MPKIFITGGARRIGRGLALNFARKKWDVAFCYNNSKIKAESTYQEIKALTPNAYFFKADLKEYGDIELGFLEMIDNFGIPDVIINNAAIFPPKKSLMELEISEWQNVINTNLNSVFYVSKIYSKYAVNNSKIINIGSIGAFEIWDGRIPYHISKTAVLQLTKILAKELAPRIMVNSVSPGSVIIDNEPDEKGVPFINSDRTPMNRNATINDIFDACWFFAASTNYITGENLLVDGGYSLTR